MCYLAQATNLIIEESTFSTSCRPRTLKPRSSVTKKKPSHLGLQYFFGWFHKVVVLLVQSNPFDRARGAGRGAFLHGCTKASPESGARPLEST